MTGPPVRTRAFVMLLAGWMALAIAAVAAVGAPATTAFATLAIGLVATATLFRSVRWGGAAAAVALVVYAVAAVAGPAAPWSLGSDDLSRLLRSLVRWQTVGPDLIVALALAGTAASAELASAGLEWDQLLRGTVSRRRPADDEEPAGTVPEGVWNHASPLPDGMRRPVRQQEEP